MLVVGLLFVKYYDIMHTYLLHCNSHTHVLSYYVKINDDYMIVYHEFLHALTCINNYILLHYVTTCMCICNYTVNLEIFVVKIFS